MWQTLKSQITFFLFFSHTHPRIHSLLTDSQSHESECLPCEQLSSVNGHHSPHCFGDGNFNPKPPPRPPTPQPFILGGPLSENNHPLYVFVSYLKNWQQSQIALISHISSCWKRFEKPAKRSARVAGPTGMFCSARCSCCDFTHSCRSPPPLHQKWNAFYLESRGPSWEKAFQLLFLTPFAFVCLLSPFSAPSLVISPCRVGFCAGGYFVCQCPRRPPAILHAAS